MTPFGGFPLLLLAALGAPAPQSLPRCQWHFEKGQTFYQEVMIDTHQDMKVNGAAVAQTQKQTFYLSFTPVRQEEDRWILRMNVQGCKVDLDLGGNRISYDSTGEGNANTPLSSIFKALTGAQFQITLDRDMNVVRFEGQDGFLARVEGADAQQTALFRRLFTEGTLKSWVADTFSVLPGRETNRGDSWTRLSRMDLPFAHYTVCSEYSCAGQDGTLVRFKVDHVGYTLEPNAAAKSGELPFAIKESTLKTRKASGHILFDQLRGRIDSSELQLEIQGELQLDMGGQVTTVALAQVQKTTVKISESNPLKR